MLHGYTMILVGELRVAHILVPSSPHIPGRGPIIPPFYLGYILGPSGPSGGWGSFAQT